MTKPTKLVSQLLGEAPVDPQNVGNPGAPVAPQMRGFSRKYIAVKLEDFEPSDELNTYLGEASEDGATFSDADIEYLIDHAPEQFRAELAELHDGLVAAKAILLILV
jgi:predicted metalloprotease with PDZ domain